MKRKTLMISTLGAVAALGVVGYAALSEASGGHGGGMHGGGMHGGGRMLQMMEQYDTNADGALTKEEVLAARGAKFKAFDANGDGVLDLTEYQALWADAMQSRMVRSFQRHDADGDGKINAEDFSKRIGRMMTWFDHNEDGKVDMSDAKMRRHGDDDDHKEKHHR